MYANSCYGARFNSRALDRDVYQDQMEMINLAVNNKADKLVQSAQNSLDPCYYKTMFLECFIPLPWVSAIQVHFLFQ